MYLQTQKYILLPVYIRISLVRSLGIYEPVCIGLYA